MKLSGHLQRKLQPWWHIIFFIKNKKVPKPQYVDQMQRSRSTTKNRRPRVGSRLKDISSVSLHLTREPAILYLLVENWFVLKKVSHQLLKHRNAASTFYCFLYDMMFLAWTLHDWEYSSYVLFLLNKSFFVFL